MIVLPRIVLLNPNTDSIMTAVMAGIANECAGKTAIFEGRTVPFGPPVITTEAGLAEAGRQVFKTGLDLIREGFAGILVSGFGDPGVLELRDRTGLPVVGIAEAGMDEASRGGRRYAIVTTTPLLRDSIARRAETYGYDATLTSIRITPGAPETVMADAVRLEHALRLACLEAIEHDGAEAILIGGGPLAPAARAIAGDLPVPLVEPVRAGAFLVASRVREATQLAR